MKKGTEPAFPTITTGRYPDLQKQYPGMSIRLKIASDAMCAMIGNSNADRVYEEEGNLIKESLKYADLLIKTEEGTR